MDSNSLHLSETHTSYLMRSFPLFATNHIMWSTINMYATENRNVMHALPKLKRRNHKVEKLYWENTTYWPSNNLLFFSKSLEQPRDKLCMLSSFHHSYILSSPKDSHFSTFSSHLIQTPFLFDLFPSPVCMCGDSV